MPLPTQFLAATSQSWTCSLPTQMAAQQPTGLFSPILPLALAVFPTQTPFALDFYASGHFLPWHHQQTSLGCPCLCPHSIEWELLLMASTTCWDLEAHCWVFPGLQNSTHSLNALTISWSVPVCLLTQTHKMHKPPKAMWGFMGSAWWSGSHEPQLTNQKLGNFCDELMSVMRFMTTPSLDWLFA